MHAVFQRILDNALLVAGLLFALGTGLASLHVGDAAAACFLACGTVLMMKGGAAPAEPEAPPMAQHAGQAAA